MLKNFSVNESFYKSLLAFVITLRFYNNKIKFLYYSYKYKLIDLEDINIYFKEKIILKKDNFFLY